MNLPDPVSVTRPSTGLLVDAFGRTARDLRVSLTEKCSLRCTYCMPEDGLPAIAEEAQMRATEVVRLVGLAHHHLGITGVRFTGGEPLMRADLEEIVAGTRARCPELEIALTTNGVGLEHRAQTLADAGVDRINVSLDTVDRREFAALTRRDRLPSVLRGIRAARRAGLGPVKLNAVPMRATVAGAPDLLDWALDEGAQLRFIEEMPLDADEAWNRRELVTAQQVLDSLSTRFNLSPIGREDPSAPAELWEVCGRTTPEGAPATVGVIATITRNFCAACDRTRLTAEGTVRSCLFSDDETALLPLLRAGASDTDIAEAWRSAMWGKQVGHGIGGSGFHRPRRSMGAIGG